MSKTCSISGPKKVRLLVKPSIMSERLGFENEGGACGTLSARYNPLRIIACPFMPLSLHRPLLA